MRKSEIFKRAWELKKTLIYYKYRPFSESLKESWSEFKKQKQDDFSTVNASFSTTKFGVTYKQLNYIYSFSNFITDLSKSEMMDRLDRMSASFIIDELKSGETVRIS